MELLSYRLSDIHYMRTLFKSVALLSKRIPQKADIFLREMYNIKQNVFESKKKLTECAYQVSSLKLLPLFCHQCVKTREP